MTVREGVELLPGGGALAFLTFTDKAQAELTFDTLREAWARTRKALERDLGMGAYALAVEVQRRGALHVHVVAQVSEDVAPVLRPAGVKKRNAAQYAWHFEEFVPMAERLGWGSIADAQLVAEADRAAAYVVKSLAGYVGKGSEALAGFTHERLRPFRTSTRWPVKFSEVCSRLPEDADPGPWRKVEVTVDAP